MSDIPRLATFDDLRVGQVIEVDADYDAYRRVGVVTTIEDGKAYYTRTDDPAESSHFFVRQGKENQRILILRDAPAQPVTVPREAVERLRDAYENRRDRNYPMPLEMALSDFFVNVDAAVDAQETEAGS